MNITSWSNLDDREIILYLFPVDGMILEFSYHRFKIPAPEDITLLGTINMQEGNHHLGDEFNIFADYQINKKMKLTGAFGWLLTAVTFSMIGFYILGGLGVITLHPKPLDWGKLFGGLIFGAGMGLLGYCPGTMIARIGEVKKDAWVGLAGMVAGILFFAVNNGFFKTHFTSKSINGDISVALGISPWIIVPVAAALFITIIYFANKVDDYRKNI